MTFNRLEPVKDSFLELSETRPSKINSWHKKLSPAKDKYTNIQTHKFIHFTHFSYSYSAVDFLHMEIRNVMKNIFVILDVELNWI